MFSGGDCRYLYALQIRFLYYLPNQLQITMQEINHQSLLQQNKHILKRNQMKYY